MSINAGHANSSTLFRRTRSTALRRVIVALIAVPTVLVGLLAMHVLAASGDPVSRHADMSLAFAMPQATDSAPPVTSAFGCDQFCGPTHNMGAMACILALLLTALAVAALVAFRGWASLTAALAAIAALIARPRGLAPPLPPSLEFLSISRI
jgi:hypothetical protein